MAKLGNGRSVGLSLGRPEKNGQMACFVCCSVVYGAYYGLPCEMDDVFAGKFGLTLIQWAYMIYYVTRNRYSPTSVESLRRSIQRTRDSRRTASRFGELIDKHGRDNWLEPLLEDLGPYIQLQIGDIANMLEVFDKSVIHLSSREISLMLIKVCTIGYIQEKPPLHFSFWFRACYWRCLQTWRFA